MYLAIKDFNPDCKEPALSKDHLQLMNFRVGELILMTIPPNKAGWFEGYRANDSERVCGIAHKNAVKQIHFK